MIGQSNFLCTPAMPSSPQYLDNLAHGQSAEERPRNFAAEKNATTTLWSSGIGRPRFCISGPASCRPEAERLGQRQRKGYTRMKRQRVLLLLLCLGMLSASAALAEVRLDSIYADHMVLQRNLPVPVRGSADAGETVSVTFRGETRQAIAGKFGRWEVVLPPGTAGGPFDILVRGSNTIRLSDVLVGDVWVASGQSNMEFTTRGVLNAASELKHANQPNIRLFHVKVSTSPYPLDEVSARSWVACSPETAPDFSAVAFFFGKEIEADQKVPIGLIESDWGGTSAEAWTSTRAISADASLMPVFASWALRMEDESSLIPQKEYEDREMARAKAEGKPQPVFTDRVDVVSRVTPGGLYNAMIAPITHFPIRGVIWYQGENNASVEQAPVYARLFQTLIQDWRRQWGEGNFPFLFVQLPNFNSGSGDGWPELREAQRQALVLRNTGMAVTIDIGDPATVHPRDKQDVGHRLALVARGVAYGEPIEYSGPLFRMQSQQGHAIRIWFDHGSGLVAKGGALKGFEIAGADKKFLPADAQIDGKNVVVSNMDIADPVFVRYSWSDNPDGNLYNEAGLPASPFQSGK